MEPRKLNDHIVPGDSANHQLEIFVHDAPGAGGAHHAYGIHGFNTETNPSVGWEYLGKNYYSIPILFQNGPIKEVGVNGVTHEALLAILIDRMRSFQKGPYSCRENAIALTHLEEALMWLQRRTVERIKRGVEGTHEK
jgi:hypothetical protein